MTDASPPPRDWGIDGTYVFDGDRSRQGYPVNKLCMSLTRPENRERFRQDEDAYMASFGLSEAQKRAIRDRDWLELVRLGGNIYYMIKIGATVGAGLYTMGAQMRGQSLDEFLATRQDKGAV
ncbi:protocatechuate 3,4-dioxygenase [Pigmentiphaga sp. H8]|uniref:protocatechuate 3,4-dioxygenase n=1 Tax=unclassified Pigmentiphaga TaxID=2626614 RepID=UPI000F5AC85C|nr:protocatechuate 3,4-dioxygenase [Pigmentiphaga sp. H8]AZG06730.1 protocatechuate 3,4-dioxygenase [Pigmentiphaga sp. H8]